MITPTCGTDESEIEGWLSVLRFTFIHKDEDNYADFGQRNPSSVRALQQPYPKIHIMHMG